MACLRRVSIGHSDGDRSTLRTTFLMLVVIGCHWMLAQGGYEGELNCSGQVLLAEVDKIIQ